MIKTVSDLLQAFLARERAALGKRKDVSHGPTIGAMYEGLTRVALRRTIPAVSPLYVASGFAVGKGGKQSPQLDCVLATDPGQPIPYTDARLFAVETIVAVIEVKKTLGAVALDDGYLNLASIVALEPAKPPPFRYSSLRTAFQQVTGYALPDDPKQLPPEVFQVFRYLVKEALAPVRILLGYEGYKTSRGLRNGVIEQVGKLVGRDGAHGPTTLPNLIASSRHSVVKLNGMPWGGRHEPHDGRVLLLASSGGISPAEVLLELIWSRLNYLGLLPSEAFGEDLEMEQWVKLFGARFVANKGWDFDAMPAAVSQPDRRGSVPWKPAEVSKDEWVLLTFMGRTDPFEFDLDAQRPPDWPSTEALQETLDLLSEKNLVGRDPTRPHVYRLLTEKLYTAWLPNGKAVAGENVSGKLERWVLNRIAASKNRQRKPPRQKKALRNEK